jgi:hypothetical protein
MASMRCGNCSVTLVIQTGSGVDVSAFATLGELIRFHVAHSSLLACAPGRFVPNGTPDHLEALRQIRDLAAATLADLEAREREGSDHG